MGDTCHPGSLQKDTSAVGVLQPGRLYVCPSVQLQRDHLAAVVQQPKVPKASKREVRQVPLRMLREHRRARSRTAGGLWGVRGGGDGPVPPHGWSCAGAEEGTALLKPGQCFLTGKGSEKPVSWRGNTPAGQPCRPRSHSHRLPWTRRAPASLWVSVSHSLLPSLAAYPRVLRAHPALPMLLTLSALRGQGFPGHGTLWELSHPLSSSRGRWEQFDKKYLSQLLMRKSAYRLRDEIWDVYYKLNIRDAISFVDQVGARGGGPGGGMAPTGAGWPGVVVHPARGHAVYPLARRWGPPLA